MSAKESAGKFWIDFYLFLIQAILHFFREIILSIFFPPFFQFVQMVISKKIQATTFAQLGSISTNATTPRVTLGLPTSLVKDTKQDVI